MGDQRNLRDGANGSFEPSPEEPYGSAMPYNPYGPPPRSMTAVADPKSPYGLPQGAAASYLGPNGPGAMHPRLPFPGILGFLVLVVIGFAANAGIGAVGMVVSSLASGTDPTQLGSTDILDAVPMAVLLGILLVASLSWPAVALAGAKLMREWSRASFRLRWPGFLPNGMAVIMGLALVPVALALEQGVSRMVPRGRNELLEMMTRHPDALAMTILGVTLIISAPIGEELLFRGLAFRGIERRHGFVVSALLVSLIFSAVHLNLTGFSALFLVSMVLCWLTSRTGSILPAIVLHATYNGLQFIALALGDHSEAAIQKALAQKSLGFPVWVLFAAVAIVILSGLVIHRFAPPPVPDRSPPTGATPV